ncbi:MAG: Ig-like domain-containing protein, partial [Erysipelotrichaceae bacterium]|nr:Ig-like domain-containing protein [Erysipelotrichaceae bacterium]
MKKLGVFLLSFFMCALLFAPQMSLSADGGSPKLTVKTNKSSYELREPINVTVQMENKTTTDMDDVQISLSKVKGLENTSEAKVDSFDTVAAGDKVTSSFQMKSKEKKQREGIVFKKSHIVKKLSSATFKNSLNYSGKVTYTSSNTKVATVASDGTVTLVGPGEGVIITATIPESDEYYEYSTSFILDVYKEKTEKKSQTLIFEKDYIAKWKDDKNFVNPLTKKGEGSGKITYYSSNPYVAFVNPDTGEVDIKHTGKVTITAYKASDEKYKSATASYTLAIFNTPVNTGADTSDSNTGLYIGLGAGAVIIAGVALGLSRKKAKKILMSLLVAAAMGITCAAPKEIKAAEQDETQVVTASTKVTVDGQEYTISVECQYVPAAAEQKKE